MLRVWHNQRFMAMKQYFTEPKDQASTSGNFVSILEQVGSIILVVCEKVD